MEMYLAGVPVYTIMLISRWSSNAFIHFIRTKLNFFPIMLQSRCSHFDLLELSQTSHFAWSLTMTPGNATIVTTPRRDTILDTTSPGGYSYQGSLFSTDQLMAQKHLMEEASSYLLLKALGEGRVEINFNSKPNHLVHILCISF